MHFPVEGTGKTLLLFTILTSCAICFGQPPAENTLNLRIGFDLTQNKDGNPALRIREVGGDSAEAERHPRAASKDYKKPSIRADSFDSKEEKGRPNESSGELARQSSGSDEGYDSDAKNRHKSTKGINPEEYEPEENAKVHRINQEDDDDDARLRRKRQVGSESKKRKAKKFSSFRKLGVAEA